MAYSAIKISANVPLPYSVLNPETSSDSPSAKSNGARLVSAKIDINHIILAIGIKIKAQLNNDCVKSVKLNVCAVNKTESKIKVILTSYEIVWAIPRNLPSSAYLELDVHPAINVG